jgi:hypothetical protein
MTTPQVNIIELIKDPQLLGLSVSPAQETLLKSMYGLPLSTEERELWRLCTGRETYPGQAFPELTCMCGARGGKDSRILCPALAYEAVFGGHERYLAKGERAIIPLVAQDQRATRVAFTYLSDYFTCSPLLASMVEEVLRFEIKLTNRVSILCFPCSQTAPRGFSMPAGGLDELGFFRLEGSADSDAEIQASIRRGMLGFPSPRLIKISTPYMKSGVLYDDFTRYFGTDSPDVLVWRAPSALMNPSLRAERLDREQRLDPSRFAREYLAEFVEDLDSFLPAAWVEAAVAPGRHELPPIEGRSYSAGVDPSGGGADAFTLSICHAEGAGAERRVIQDVMRGWSRSRSQTVDLTGAVGEMADIVKRYGLYSVHGDQYAGAWVRQAFDTHGIRYEQAPDKATAYGATEPFFAQGAIEILDHPKLVRELKLLERRARPGGKLRVDHPRGGHDDHSNALAVSLVPLVHNVREEGDYGYTFGPVDGPALSQRDSRPGSERLPETHNGVTVAEHAAAGCPRCVARVHDLRG